MRFAAALIPLSLAAAAIASPVKRDSSPTCDGQGYAQDTNAPSNAATSGPGYLTYKVVTGSQSDAYAACEAYCTANSKCVYGQIFVDNTAHSPSKGGYTCSLWSQFQSQSYYTNQAGTGLITSGMSFTNQCSPTCDTKKYGQVVSAPTGAATSGPQYLTMKALYPQSGSEADAYSECEDFCASVNGCVFGNVFVDNTAGSPSKGGFTCSVWGAQQPKSAYTNQRGTGLITNSLSFTSQCN